MNGATNTTGDALEESSAVLNCTKLNLQVGKRSARSNPQRLLPLSWLECTSLVSVGDDKAGHFVNGVCSHRKNSGTDYER